MDATFISGKSWKNNTNGGDIAHHNLELFDFHPGIIIFYAVTILSKDKEYLIKEPQNIIREWRGHYIIRRMIFMKEETFTLIYSLYKEMITEYRNEK